MKKFVVINSIVSLLAQAVSIACGFVLPRVILECFGSEINGLTHSIKQFLGIISFLDMGVGQVLRSALYRPIAEKNMGEIGRTIASGQRFYRKIAFLLVIYTAILMCIYPILIERKFGWFYTSTLIAAMAISLFAEYYFGIAYAQLLQADQCGYIIYIAQIVSNIVNLLLCVWMVNKGASIHQIKITSSLILLIRPVTIHIYVKRRYRIEHKVRYKGEAVGNMRYGIAQHVAAVILDGTDVIVLTLMSNLTNVSIYSVYYMVISGIQQFYQAITGSMHSAVGLLWAKQNEDEMNRVFSLIEVLLHFTVVFLFSCTAVLIVPFVRVYMAGISSDEYIRPMFAALLVIAYGVRCLRTPYNMWILAAGHYKQTQVCHITTAAINLMISVITVKSWGLVGIAAGTLVAMLYQTIWMAVYNSKHLLKRPLRSILKPFVIDGITALIIYLSAGVIKLDRISYTGWIALAIKVVIIAIGVDVVTFTVFYRKEARNICRRFIEKYIHQSGCH